MLVMQSHTSTQMVHAYVYVYVNSLNFYSFYKQLNKHLKLLFPFIFAFQQKKNNSKELYSGAQNHHINQNDVSCYTSRRNSTTSTANSEPQEIAPHLVK